MNNDFLGFEKYRRDKPSNSQPEDASSTSKETKEPPRPSKSESRPDMKKVFEKEFKIDFSTFGQKKSGSGSGGSGEDGNQSDQLIKLAAGTAAVLGLYFLNSQVSTFTVHNQYFIKNEFIFKLKYFFVKLIIFAAL